MIYLLSVLIALAVAGIEAVSYPGFIANHLHLGAQIFYLASLGLSFIPFVAPHLLKRSLLWLASLFTASYVVLIFLEKINYPNFVYTVTHINLLTFLLFVSLTWFHYFRLNQEPFLKSLLIACLIYVSADGAGRTLEIMFRELRRIAAHPFATYAQKMEMAYPGFYPAMQAVDVLTPPDATILIPPQAHPWEEEGNGAMVTYFVYPRHVANYDPTNHNELLHPHTYILIAQGAWKSFPADPSGWPKVPVRADKLIKIDLKTHTNVTYNRNYDPTTDQWDWGLIEVPHE